MCLLCAYKLSMQFHRYSVLDLQLIFYCFLFTSQMVLSVWTDAENDMLTESPGYLASTLTFQHQMDQNTQQKKCVKSCSLIGRINSSQILFIFWFGHWEADWDPPFQEILYGLVSALGCQCLCSTELDSSLNKTCQGPTLILRRWMISCAFKC